MHQIKCPHCDQVFTIDEGEYSQLLAQVRTVEFDKEVATRLKETAALVEAKAQNHLQTVLSEKEQEMTALHLELEKVKSHLDKLNLQKEKEFQDSLSQLKTERDNLKHALELQKQKEELALATVKQSYDLQLEAANEQVAFYKNFKAQQSTKAIGESLEQYAETEFNKVRAYAFPNAEFVKDNEISSRGSKGDFIFREKDDSGLEFLSIMFEMKNEADETKTKHKNTDFLKELDKDRREKGCEYAILVSMLEIDNDYYNTGIVDVSHLYEKMYVIRPQFFIQMIGILRNAARNSLAYKQELALMKSQNLDITHFEEDLEAFKLAFSKNYHSASSNFKKAIDEIDKAIKRMEEIKRFLTTSENQLRLANNKLDEVSIKKLTRKNPTMREKFEALRKEK